MRDRKLLLFAALLGASACAQHGQRAGLISPASRPASAPAGVNKAALDALAEEVRTGKFGNTHAILVGHREQLAYEAYFKGDERNWGEDWTRGVMFGPGRLHDARSVTKTVVSTLVGIALHQGHIDSLDAPLSQLLPARNHLLTGEKAKLTLRHLLTMTAGFAWNEDGPSAENDELRMYASSDPLAYVLERDLTTEPGTRWTYSGGTTHLLGVILEQSTGKPLEEYAREVLFEPVGIERFEWRGDFGGMPAPASGLRLLPRDFLKLGTLFANGGRWNGRQIIPSSWLEEAMRPQVEIALAPNALPAASRSAYGFQWWYDEYDVAGDRVRISAASGLGGQRIFVVRDRNLVVVVLSGHFGRPGTTWIPEQILHRVLEAAPRG
jgi:CubicO group peptidase (beta-lactamase class C family)